MADTLTGVIERVTFHNLDSGYCVLRVRAAGHRDVVTVVGCLSQAVAGEYVEAAGGWVTDRTHGMQFRADGLKTTPPHTAEGIAKYLGSGLVKGIGPKYAKKIVEVFGAQTLDVIDRSPGYLAQVKGIGPKRIQQIREGWETTRGVREIMSFLMSYGMGTARAVKIYKAYGDTAIEQVKANPYRLSEDIWGVGFRTADELALKLGLPRDAPHRAQAAVRHVLRDASGTKGHVGLPEPLLVEETAALTQISPDQVRAAIEHLRLADEVVRDSVELVSLSPSSGERGRGEGAAVDSLSPRLCGGRGGGVRGDSESPTPSPLPLSPEAGEREPTDPLIYLKPLFLAELGIARLVTALRGGAHPLPAGAADAALARAEGAMGLRLAPSQRAAVRAAVTDKLLVVTGGPGTGKTTIVRAVIELFIAAGQRVGLAAPTGRAAKRLAESTGREARTIHRLLEFDAGLNNFRKGRENPLDLDLLVVDEASMVDVRLMYSLLQAVPPWACVILVGDVDQLPSVGAGAVLADLIGSGAVPVARLTEIHRQAEASDIVRAAHAVNHGEEPVSSRPGDGDFYFVEADDPGTVIARILTMVKDRIPARFGLDPFRDVQVLSPMNKSELGVQNLNAVLQQALNPGGSGAREVQRYGTTFRVGDKVLQTRNNYQREVFNGDIGRVTGVEPVDQIVTVDFEGRSVDYDFGDLDELQLAFAVSVHKAQGSEYPAVVIPVHTQHFVMLQRNLLYTGITRGRKLVVLVGSRKAVWLAVTKADTARRFSLLRWRLRRLAPSPTGGKGEGARAPSAPGSAGGEGEG